MIFIDIYIKKKIKKNLNVKLLANWKLKKFHPQIDSECDNGDASPLSHSELIFGWVGFHSGITAK